MKLQGRGTKMKTKTINNISKFFKEKCCNDGDKIPPAEYEGAMDAANVLMYVPKIKGNEEVFNIFETEKHAVPKIEKEKYHSCRYAKSYLKAILKTLIEDDCSEAVTISVGQGMPLIMEDKHNGFILAPRWKQNSEIHEWHDCEILQE